eukprot:TRINITY_DN913_c0_g1_i1.p1 TRINITY_DN913_c0_g1~~TRINITY_DN913_c0_g1_i1.p1  ORF type:complete len:130 (-),score=28.76 TRINITY_DN913_c0_g1_i1:158-547(-)
MYSKNNCSKGCLVVQALEANLVTQLLELLDKGADALPHSHVIKAHLAKALKEMEKDAVHGGGVSAVLNASPVWDSYRDQKHDLFILPDSAPKYLTSGSTGQRLMITNASSNPLYTGKVDDTPPPLDDSN